MVGRVPGHILGVTPASFRTCRVPRGAISATHSQAALFLGLRAATRAEGSRRRRQRPILATPSGGRARGSRPVPRPTVTGLPAPRVRSAPAIAGTCADSAQASRDSPRPQNLDVSTAHSGSDSPPAAALPAPHPDFQQLQLVRFQPRGHWGICAHLDSTPRRQNLPDHWSTATLANAATARARSAGPAHPVPPSARAVSAANASEDRRWCGTRSNRRAPAIPGAVRAADRAART